MKLSVQNLMKSYSGRKVVKDVSFEVKQGEIVGLLGPNGAGKTTSFYMTVGLIKPNGGSIFLDNKDNFSEIEWKNLYKLSEETFVEETDSLKKSAAGAGLNDND